MAHVLLSFAALAQRWVILAILASAWLAVPAAAQPLIIDDFEEGPFTK